MKESELKIDWKKHVCYSKQAKKVIRKRLAEQFDAAETEKRWEDVQLKYVEYLETLPYLGERKTDIKDAAEEQRCPAGYRMYAEPFDPDTSLNSARLRSLQKRMTCLKLCPQCAMAIIRQWNCCMRD